MRKLTFFFVAVTLASLTLSCPDDQKCLQCHENQKQNECVICQDMLLNPSNGLCDITPTLNIPNCLEYKDPTTCLRCKFGYRVTVKDAISTCEGCPSKNCARCDGKSESCTHCFHNLKLSLDETGRQICGPEMTNIANCEINRVGIAQDQCEVCVKGHTLNQDNLCVKSALDFCWKANVPDRCLVCHYGFYMGKNGQCAKKTSVWTIIAIVLAVVTAGLVGYMCLRKKQTFEIKNSLLD